MNRMLMVVLAAASVTLFAGAVWAEQTVVCQPVCGLAHSTEAKKQDPKHEKDHPKHGKENAASHMNQHGSDHNKAGISAPGGGGSGSGGPVVLF